MLKTTILSAPGPNALDRTFNSVLLAPQPICSNSIEMLNLTQASQYKNSIENFLPAIILYSTNILADPNLWNDDFRSMFLFGTNEFLQSNVCNIACFLHYMASFLRQQNLEDCNSNDILQPASFRDTI